MHLSSALPSQQWLQWQHWQSFCFSRHWKVSRLGGREWKQPCQAPGPLLSQYCRRLDSQEQKTMSASRGLAMKKMHGSDQSSEWLDQLSHLESASMKYGGVFLSEWERAKKRDSGSCGTRPIKTTSLGYWTWTKCTIPKTRSVFNFMRSCVDCCLTWSRACQFETLSDLRYCRCYVTVRYAIKVCQMHLKSWII